MKKMENKWWKKSVIGTILATFLVGSASVGWAAKPYAQYPSTAEKRYLDYSAGLHNELNGWGGWRRAEYYWSKKFLLESPTRFINNNILIHLSGHGSPHKYQASDGTVNLGGGKCAWGRTNKTAFVAFQSCKVTKLETNWRQYWKAYSWANRYKRPFAGLHAVLGFRTNHTNVTPNFLIGMKSGEWLADEFGENLKSRYSVRRAWYKAAESSRSAFWYMPSSKNKPSIFYIRKHKHEDIQDASVTRSSSFVRYGNSGYLVDAYYMR